MDRLKFALVIAALVATSQTSFGQTLSAGAPVQPSAAPVQAVYVVIGDVRNFNYYRLSGRTTVREAAFNAGPVADSFSVSVLRTAQDRSAWTQVISSTSTDSGELVMNGDVLVVQSLVPVTEPVQKNAALRTEAGVVVVALADDTIAVGDVLQQTNSLPAPGQRLVMSSRFQGRTATASLGLLDRVAHGDVMTVSSGPRNGLRGFGNLVPAYSEWQGAGPTTLQPPPVPDTTHLQIGYPGTLPGESSHHFSMPVPAFAELSADSADSATQSQSQSPGFADGSLSSGNAPADPFVGAGDSDDHAPSALRSVSQASLTSGIDGPEAAPQPPVERVSSTGLYDVDDPTRGATGGMSHWNFIFIAGLLIAGTLILAGSLRADEATETEEHRTMERRRTGSIVSEEADSRNMDAVVTVADITAGIQAGASQQQVQPEPVDVTSNRDLKPAAAIVFQSAVPAQPTMELVAPGEWFSTDLFNKQQKSDSAPPVISGTVTETTTEQILDEAAQAAPELTDISLESPLELLNRMKKQVADYLAEIDSVSSAIASPKEDSVLPDMEKSTVAAIPREPRATIPEEKKTSQVSATEFTELEDLLQNRLPIDLCEARLPLRVALFGRPAGPRRLRIDAAHAAVPAPHMNRSAERKQEEPVAASLSSTTSSTQDTDAADGLNRALHYLQERTDS